MSNYDKILNEIQDPLLDNYFTSTNLIRYGLPQLDILLLHN